MSITYLMRSKNYYPALASDLGTELKRIILKNRSPGGEKPPLSGNSDSMHKSRIRPLAKEECFQSGYSTMVHHWQMCRKTGRDFKASVNVTNSSTTVTVTPQCVVSTVQKKLI